MKQLAECLGLKAITKLHYLGKIIHTIDIDVQIVANENIDGLENQE